MNKAQAIQRINALGASLDEDNTEITRSYKSAYVDAPRGYHFDYSSASCIALYWYHGPAAEFWETLVEMVESGMQRI